MAQKMYNNLPEKFSDELQQKIMSLVFHDADEWNNAIQNELKDASDDEKSKFILKKIDSLMNYDFISEKILILVLSLFIIIGGLIKIFG